jgi:hypothetical protein
MEKELAYLKTSNGIEFKLTSEKLYISSSLGMETFALRSINGIGVIDDIDNLNGQLSAKKQLNFLNKTWGVFFVLVGAMICFLESIVAYVFAAFSLAIGIYLLSINQKPPKLFSNVRIMLNGMNRDFSFIKNENDSSIVAEFVARVEDTLTAFHKNS